MSATSCCRAWRMSPLCARRTRMRASSRIDKTAAEKAPGVIAVVTGAELAKVMTPWVGVLTHLKGLKSAPQSAIAVERACWQGEAVCAVVARTRAQAEDACELVDVTYEELPAVTDAETALDSEDAGDPALARRQSLLRAQARCRRRRQGLRRVRRRGGDHLRHRPSHRRHQRAARRSSPTGTPASSA